MTATADRWRENWRVVGAPGGVRVQLRRRRPKADLETDLRSLSSGTAVVFTASAPGAVRRCRAFASRAGIEIESEYLAFPSADAPCYLVEDAPAPVRFFRDCVLAPPPRPGVVLPMAAGLRALTPWRAMRRLAPGRVVVGRRA